MKLFVLITSLWIFSFAVSAHAKNMTLGVDLDLIDWQKLCSNVKPVTFKLDSGKVCSVVHPADLQVYLGQFDNGIKMPPDKIACKTAKRVFNEYTHSNNGRWGHCRRKFAGIYQRLNGSIDDITIEQVVSFRDTYLKSGVVDAGEVIRVRERIIEHKRKIKQMRE